MIFVGLFIVALVFAHTEEYFGKLFKYEDDFSFTPDFFASGGLIDIKKFSDTNQTGLEIKKLSLHGEVEFVKKHLFSYSNEGSDEETYLNDLRMGQRFFLESKIYSTALLQKVQDEKFLLELLFLKFTMEGGNIEEAISIMSFDTDDTIAQADTSFSSSLYPISDGNFVTLINIVLREEERNAYCIIICFSEEGKIQFTKKINSPINLNAMVQKETGLSFFGTLTDDKTLACVTLDKKDGKLIEDESFVVSLSSDEKYKDKVEEISMFPESVSLVDSKYLVRTRNGGLLKLDSSKIDLFYSITYECTCEDDKSATFLYDMKYPQPEDDETPRIGLFGYKITERGIILAHLTLSLDSEEVLTSSKALMPSDVSAVFQEPVGIFAGESGIVAYSNGYFYTVPNTFEGCGIRSWEDTVGQGPLADIDGTFKIQKNDPELTHLKKQDEEDLKKSVEDYDPQKTDEKNDVKELFSVENMDEEELNKIVENTVVTDLCWSCDFLWNDDVAVCSGNGTCVTNGSCVCEENYTGEKCDVFENEKKEDDDPKPEDKDEILCDEIEASDPLVCSGHGECKKTGEEDGKDGEKVVITECECEEGWKGEFCGDEDDDKKKDPEITCFGVGENEEDVCGEHGKCVAEDTCECDEGWAKSEDEICNKKEEGKKKDDDENEWYCYGISKELDFVCHAKGDCVSSNNCICDSGWFGMTCQVPSCFGKLANLTGLPQSEEPCNGNGDCTDVDECECHEMYKGEQCEIPKCQNLFADEHGVCSGHGRCTGVNHCECEVSEHSDKSTWDGPDCEHTTCFGLSGADSGVCSGHGDCVDVDTCSCKFGYEGGQCESVNCFGWDGMDDDVCSGHGNCVTKDTCNCTLGFTGEICQLSPCAGIEMTSKRVCSGHGRCETLKHPKTKELIGMCKCDKDYKRSTRNYGHCIHHPEKTKDYNDRINKDFGEDDVATEGMSTTIQVVLISMGVAILLLLIYSAVTTICLFRKQIFSSEEKVMKGYRPIRSNKGRRRKKKRKERDLDGSSDLDDVQLSDLEFKDEEEEEERNLMVFDENRKQVGNSSTDISDF